VILQACTHAIPAVPEDGAAQAHVAVGRAIAVLTGERSRIYQPAVRWFEIQNARTKEIFTVDIMSDDERFILPLAPGDYELTRVQISEGPFLSMAQVTSKFSVTQERITYLGTWRFGVDSPKYGRMVFISMVSDEKDRDETAQSLGLQFPSFDGAVVRTVLPQPSELQTRLFEVMPYPRYPRYFRRHWW
jgi:hypothetical protein